MDSLAFDVVCLSHLRWDSVYQRPQHLLSRCGREYRTFFVEEPDFAGDSNFMELVECSPGVIRVIPRLAEGMRAVDTWVVQSRLLEEVLREQGVCDYVLWYYTPMGLRFSRRLTPLLTVFDCMDELSAFAEAPPGILEEEAELLRRADLVFAGGRSLYEAKRRRHPHVYEFPSSVDGDHFKRARNNFEEPTDQRSIPHPRLGFYGVLDERLDTALIDAVASRHPDWQIVLVGPVCEAKIDPAILPRRPNIHYLGAKSYDKLPQYLGGWDVALMPFAHNESTRFISPTKTPEYLAAGKPVVSTSIRDVVNPYGDKGFVSIADSPDEFAKAIDDILTGVNPLDSEAVDGFLAGMSWDTTWSRMNELMQTAIQPETSAARPKDTATRALPERVRSRRKEVA